MSNYNDLDTGLIDYQITDLNMSTYNCSMLDDTITLGAGISTVTVGDIGHTSSTVSSIWTNDVVSTAAGTVSVPANGDIKIGDRSLKEFMTKVEERLAILVPDPEKLEKFEALKTAYDHYKLIENLCQQESQEEQ